MHRDVSLLALFVIVIHVVAIMLDSYVKIPLSAAVLPFGSSYSPFWTGLGALSFDLMIAIVVTSLVRKRLGYRTWRFVHWFAYVSWPIAVAHGLATGSDSGAAWALGADDRMHRGRGRDGRDAPPIRRRRPDARSLSLLRR